MASDKMSKTIGVALGVCLVCSVLVSTAAVELKGIQERNQKLDLITNILVAGDLLQDDVDVQKVFETKIKADLIELNTGKYVSEEQYTAELSPATFDINTLANSAEYGTDIPSEIDIAGIKRMPKYMAVYKVFDGDEIQKYILPIYGKGLWSTMYGFIAFNKDLKTVEGFTYYQHGETPGLGGEVDNPKWKAKWVGKQAFDDSWNLKIEVIKSVVDLSSDKAKYQIDGLSGSTLTTRGVNNTVQFWLGKNGYGPFFNNLRGEM